MNAGIYKLIFSKRLNALVVVGEICSSQGKAPGTTRAVKRSARGMVQIVRILGMFSSGALLVSTAWATPAPDALPTGGQVVQGSATISQTAAQMNINQASQRAAINWQTFDVGGNAKVQIIQPNQAAVLLNRVVTNKPSEIYGKIEANGQVILVNNNGIIFGKDGSASASSFTATTLDISDQDFMAGKNRFTSRGAQGEIINHGSIEAKNGGYVALLGAKVTNDGKIVTHNGSVALGAAESIAISSGKIKMELSAGSVNAAVENTKNGVIVTEGGDVYLQAAAANQALASITHSGQIDTSGEQAGKAILLADSGEIKVDGVITANSTNAANKGGDIIIGRDQQTGVLAQTTDVSGARLESKKGFVETSGHQLKTDAVIVKAKEWLLDPDNIDITGDNTAVAAGYSKIKASDIQTNLNNGTSVTVSTTAPGTNQPSYVGSTGTGDGNILVNETITKSAGGDATLTLIADNKIDVNKAITGNSADGLLNLDFTAKGTTNSTNDVTNSDGINLNAVVNVNGNVKLTGTNSNTDVNKLQNGVHIAQKLTVKSIDITGTSNGTPASGIGVRVMADVEATGGDVKMIGTGNSQWGIYSDKQIKASDSVELTGSSTKSTGVHLQGAAANVVATTGDVTITGTAQASGVYGVNQSLATVTANQGTVKITGSNNAGGAVYHNQATVNAKNIEIIAHATGGAGSGYNATNIGTEATATNLTATGGDVIITADSKSSVGVSWQSLGSIKATKDNNRVGGNINITGTSSATDTGNGSHGLMIARGSVLADNDIVFNGTQNGVGGNGAGVMVTTDGTAGAQTTLTAGRDVKMTGSAKGGQGVQFKAGVANGINQITATNGVISVKGSTEAPSFNTGASYLAGISLGGNTATDLRMTAAGNIDLMGYNQYSGTAVQRYSGTAANNARGLMSSTTASINLTSNNGSVNLGGFLPNVTGGTGIGLDLRSNLTLSSNTGSHLTGYLNTSNNSTATGQGVWLQGKDPATNPVTPITIAKGDLTVRGTGQSGINLGNLGGSITEIKTTDSSSKQNINLIGYGTSGYGVYANGGATSHDFVKASGDINVIGWSANGATVTDHGVYLLGNGSRWTGNNMTISAMSAGKGNAVNIFQTPITTAGKFTIQGATKTTLAPDSNNTSFMIDTVQAAAGSYAQSTYTNPTPIPSQPELVNGVEVNAPITAADTISIKGQSATNMGVALRGGVNGAIKTTNNANIEIDGVTTSTLVSGTPIPPRPRGVSAETNIGDENSGAITIKGKDMAQTIGTGVYMAGGVISSKQKITFEGSGQLGVNLDGGTVKSLAGGGDFANADSILVKGAGVGIAGVMVANTITNESTNGATTLKVVPTLQDSKTSGVWLKNTTNITSNNNVYMNNTGGTIDNAGILTAGNQSSGTGQFGVRLSGQVTAKNLYVAGSASNNAGVNISPLADNSANGNPFTVTGNTYIYGRSLGSVSNTSYGVQVSPLGLRSNSGDLAITGESAGVAGVLAVGKIDAKQSNVTVKGSLTAAAPNNATVAGVWFANYDDATNNVHTIGAIDAKTYQVEGKGFGGALNNPTVQQNGVLLTAGDFKSSTGDSKITGISYAQSGNQANPTGLGNGITQLGAVSYTVASGASLTMDGQQQASGGNSYGWFSSSSGTSTFNGDGSITLNGSSKTGIGFLNSGAITTNGKGDLKINGVSTVAANSANEANGSYINANVIATAGAKISITGSTTSQHTADERSAGVYIANKYVGNGPTVNASAVSIEGQSSTEGIHNAGTIYANGQVSLSGHGLPNLADPNQYGVKLASTSNIRSLKGSDLTGQDAILIAGKVSDKDAKSVILDGSIFNRSQGGDTTIKGEVGVIDGSAGGSVHNYTAATTPSGAAQSGDSGKINILATDSNGVTIT